MGYLLLANRLAHPMFASDIFSSAVETRGHPINPNPNVCYLCFVAVIIFLL